MNNKELFSMRTKVFAFYSKSVFKVDTHYGRTSSLSNISTEGRERTEEEVMEKMGNV